MNALEIAAVALAGLYAVDRLGKVAAVARFFARPTPAVAAWPSVTVLQPVTRGATNLAGNLESRARQDYPATVQSIFVCDAADADSQAVCARFPGQIVPVAPDRDDIASKVAKMRAGLAHATGDILLFLDDDIALPPDALRVLVAHLQPPGAGAVFGLACQSSWENPWSARMSAFVNANALLSYIPITFWTEPYTVTGHCFALKRDVFDRIGGLDGVDTFRIDDDHEIARRVRAAGLRCVQSPLVYVVANHLPTRRAYGVQMRRWFIIPRQSMLPFLTPRESVFSTVLSAGNLLPPLLLLLALAARTAIAWAAFGGALALFLAVAFGCEARWLPRRMPARWWPLLPLVALVSPLEIVAALLFSGNEIEWRGRRLRIKRGGDFEEVSS